MSEPSKQNPYGHEETCDCAVCDDIAFRRSLPAKCFVDNDGVTDCDKLRQKVQAKHDANCLLRLLLETLPIQLEQHELTHDRTACAMMIQDSIDYLFRGGEDTLIESPSNDEQQMLKLAYMMGQRTEQALSEHLRKELNEANKSLDEYRAHVDKWRLWYDNASEDAKKWRRDAQDFYGALVKIAEMFEYYCTRNITSAREYNEREMMRWAKDRIQQAHREGWEQGKKEADSLFLDLVDVVLESKPVVQSARRAIAAMEYGCEK